MEFLLPALQAIKEGIDVRDVIAVILVSVVVAQLRDLTRLQEGTNVRLDSLGKKLDQHGSHQTARMEEIRKFMVDWWQRFAPKLPPHA